MKQSMNNWKPWIAASHMAGFIMTLCEGAGSMKQAIGIYRLKMFPAPPDEATGTEDQDRQYDEKPKTQDAGAEL